MKTAFKTSFLKDVKKAPITLLPELNIIITESEKASSLREITNLKKLKGHDIAYRIKLKQFRICFYYANDVIIFTRFLPRKDVYKFFP
jgi:mRNA interferase RelE/StbE